MSHRSVEGGCPGFRRLEALHRRDFLRVGGLGALGLSLPELLAAEARGSNYLGAESNARARACILLFLSGGPSHLETFDPKPLANSECRTLFPVQDTNVPGIQLTEPLGGLARQAHRFTLIRSLWHKYGGHFGGHRYTLTGHAAPGNADEPARSDDAPGIQALATRHLKSRGAIPPAVMAPWPATDQGNSVSGGMGGGILGKQYDPVLVEVDPKSLERDGAMPVFRIPEFALRPEMTPERVRGRRDLLGLIDDQRRQLAVTAAARQMNAHYARAYDLLTSPEIKQAFDLDQEDARLRERYGRNAFGQACLLGRRLVESGARFIQVNFSRTVTQKSYGWDTHDNGEKTLKDELLPKLNAGLATLLDDLAERGLLDETLVVAMGEFGRTPRVKPGGGRDHWTGCYSALLAGGGVKGGFVHGKSDRTGAYPLENPVEPRDLLTTILTLLGVPTFQVDPLGRAAPIFEGARAVEEIIA